MDMYTPNGFRLWSAQCAPVHIEDPEKPLLVLDLDHTILRFAFASPLRQTCFLSPPHRVLFFLHICMHACAHAYARVCICAERTNSSEDSNAAGDFVSHPRQGLAHFMQTVQREYRFFCCHAGTPEKYACIFGRVFKGFYGRLRIFTHGIRSYALQACGKVRVSPDNITEYDWSGRRRLIYTRENAMCDENGHHRKHFSVLFCKRCRSRAVALDDQPVVWQDACVLPADDPSLGHGMRPPGYFLRGSRHCTSCCLSCRADFLFDVSDHAAQVETSSASCLSFTAEVATTEPSRMSPRTWCRRPDFCAWAAITPRHISEAVL